MFNNHEQASSSDGVFDYYEYRAKQLATDGYVWSKSLTKYHDGLYYTTFTRDDCIYYSFYVLAQAQGHGFGTEFAEDFLQNKVIVTVPSCNIEGWLQKMNIQYVLVDVEDF